MKNIFLIFLFGFALLPGYLKAQPSTITLSSTPKQPIKGWGCFIGNRNKYGGIAGEGPLADAVFSLGITCVRTNIEPEMYLSGSTVDDIVLDEALLDDALSTIGIIKNRGLSYFLSCWSPPAVWKLPNRSVLGSVNVGTKDNPDFVGQYLDASKVQEYCNFYVKSLLRIRERSGTLPTHISVQNEPNIGPDNYAGCLYHPIWAGGGGNELWQNVVKTMRRTLDTHGLNAVKIHGTDDGDPFTSIAWMELLGQPGFTAFDTDPELLNAINAYAFHTYTDYTFNFNGFKVYPSDIAASIEKYPKDCWMTEWNDGSDGDLWADAVNTARHLATDLETMPFTHWVYWIGAGYSNAYFGPNGEGLIDSEDGTELFGSGYHKHALLLKKLWNLVRPNEGWRVKTCASNDAAFNNFNPANGNLSRLIAFSKPSESVLLIVNDGNASKSVTVSGLEGNLASTFQSSPTQDMVATATNASFAGGSYTLSVPARSIIVLHSAASLAPPPNQAPSVLLTAPLNNASFNEGSTVSLTATANDPDGSISKVEFYNGATLLGSSIASPYSFNWANVPAGNYVLTAKAYDDKGATVSSAPVNIRVNVPPPPAGNLPPIVSLTSPLNNTTFVARSPIPLTATASDPDGSISKVEFYNGATLLGSSMASPYNFNWANVPAGNYVLTAKAYDDKGATTSSMPIRITVSSVAPANQAPVVRLTSPANNATFAQGNLIVLQASAIDADGSITKVEFYHGNTLLSTSTTGPYQFNWPNVPVGNYQLSAKAYDDKGAMTTSAIINIVVNALPPAANQPPIIAFISPANNATFSQGNTIPLQASASDADGAISKVEFYNGATLLSTYLLEPYEFNWLNVPPGSYILTAKATDDKGATTSSTPISINVEKEVENDKLQVSNTFSPNADGVDDFWEIKNIDRYPSYRVIVFDRYGNKVLDAKPYSNNWDGVYKGKLLPAEAYYYIIKQSEEKVKQGSLTLLR